LKKLFITLGIVLQIFFITEVFAASVTSNVHINENQGATYRFSPTIESQYTATVPEIVFNNTVQKWITNGDLLKEHTDAIWNSTETGYQFKFSNIESLEGSSVWKSIKSSTQVLVRNLFNRYKQKEWSKLCGVSSTTENDNGDLTFSKGETNYIVYKELKKVFKTGIFCDTTKIYDEFNDDVSKAIWVEVKEENKVYFADPATGSIKIEFADESTPITLSLHSGPTRSQTVPKGFIQEESKISEIIDFEERKNQNVSFILKKDSSQFISSDDTTERFNKIASQSNAEVVNDYWVTLAGKFAVRTANALDWILGVENHSYESETIQKLTNTVINFANLSFIIVLIILAFLLNFKIFFSPSYILKLIMIIIFSFVLINFSSPVVRLIIHGSNVLENTFRQIPKVNDEGYKNIGAEDLMSVANTNLNYSFVGKRIMYYMPRKDTKWPADALEKEEIRNSLSVTKDDYYIDLYSDAYIINIALVFLISIAHWGIILFLFLRYIILWVILIIAPILFFLFIFSGSREYWRYWKWLFIRWIMIGPIIAILLNVLVHIWRNIGVPVNSSYSGLEVFPQVTNLFIYSPFETFVSTGSIEDMMKIIGGIIMLLLVPFFAIWLTRIMRSFDSMAITGSSQSSGFLFRGENPSFSPDVPDEPDPNSPSGNNPKDPKNPSTPQYQYMSPFDKSFAKLAKVLQDKFPQSTFAKKLTKEEETSKGVVSTNDMTKNLKDISEIQKQSTIQDISSVVEKMSTKDIASVLKSFDKNEIKNYGIVTRNSTSMINELTKRKKEGDTEAETLLNNIESRTTTKSGKVNESKSENQVPEISNEKSSQLSQESGTPISEKEGDILSSTNKEKHKAAELPEGKISVKFDESMQEAETVDAEQETSQAKHKAAELPEGKTSVKFDESIQEAETVDAERETSQIKQKSAELPKGQTSIKFDGREEETEKVDVQNNNVQSKQKVSQASKQESSDDDKSNKNNKEKDHDTKKESNENSATSSSSDDNSDVILNKSSEDEEETSSKGEKIAKLTEGKTSVKFEDNKEISKVFSSSEQVKKEETNSFYSKSSEKKESSMNSNDQLSKTYNKANNNEPDDKKTSPADEKQNKNEILEEEDESVKPNNNGYNEDISESPENEEFIDTDDDILNNKN